MHWRDGKGYKLSVKMEQGKEGSSCAHGVLLVTSSKSLQLRFLILRWWHYTPSGSRRL